MSPEDIALANALRTDDDMSMIPTLQKPVMIKLPALLPHTRISVPDSLGRDLKNIDPATGEYMVPAGETVNSGMTVDELMRLHRAEHPYPFAQSIQDAGDIVGWVPPYGPIPAAIQTAGDALYAGGAAYQAYKGVPGKRAEALAGLAAMLSPIPVNKVMSGASKGVKAGVELGVGQTSQEIGETVGDYQMYNSDDARALRKYQEWLKE